MVKLQTTVFYRARGTGLARVIGKEGRFMHIQMMSYLHLCRLNMQLAWSGIYSFQGSRDLHFGAQVVKETHSGILLFIL
jgi:hypothetical protein